MKIVVQLTNFHARLESTISRIWIKKWKTSFNKFRFSSVSQEDYALENTIIDLGYVLFDILNKF
jgi:hypothetical protein